MLRANASVPETKFLTELDSFVERVDAIDTAPGSQQLLGRIADEFGFENFTYLGGKTITVNGVRQFDLHEPPFCITNFPDEWQRLYIQNDYYKIDPAILHLMSSILPATWDEFAATTPLVSSQRKMLGDAADFGLQRGFTIPIHGPSGEFGLLSLTSSVRTEEFARRIERSRHTLHLLAIHLHNALYQRIRNPEPPAAAVRLTQREVEVLRWTAEGKTSWEISGILNLSERTVNFHLDRAKKKLGVFSKTHAVAKMYTLGITKIF